MRQFLATQNRLSIGNISVDVGNLTADEAQALRQRLQAAVAGIEVPNLTGAVHINELQVRLPGSQIHGTASKKADAIRHAVNDAIRTYLVQHERVP